MLNLIKRHLYKTGLINYYRSTRSLVSREVRNWLKSGCPSPAPHTVKIRIVHSYINRYKLNKFIETGTLYGDTLISLAVKGIQCTSIELDSQLYEKAKINFVGRSNVNLMLGDSGKILPKILKTLDEPALFWLDAHYSHGITARGEADTPISIELSAILDHYIKSHVILIDDAREFNGANGYPYLHKLFEAIAENGNYETMVSCDIIRLTPIRK